MFNSKFFSFMHSWGLKFIKFEDLDSTLRITHYEVSVSLISLPGERYPAGTKSPCSAAGPEHFGGADAPL